MRLKYNAPVILTFALVCSIIYILDRFVVMGLMDFFMVGTAVDVTNPFSIVSLVTHVLGHISLEHLMGNLTFILLIGPIVEEKYGSRKMLIMLILTALITGILNITFFSTGLMGASGIVFMLILLVSFTNTNEGEIPLSFVLVAFLFIGKEVLQALQADQISQFAHIIGGFCGSIFGFAGRKRSMV